MQKLFELLYTSTLAPGTSVTEVPSIVATARLRNPPQELTGLLVFDGLHFCQHLEGPQRAVMSCIERIRQDLRHVDFEIVHHGDIAQRRFRRFTMGYAMSDADDFMQQIRALDGMDAMQRLLALVPTLDLDA